MAGYFATEDFKTGPKWDEEVKMYSSSPLPHKPLLFPHTSHCNSEEARLTKITSNVLHLASLHSPVPLQGQALHAWLKGPPHLLRIRLHRSASCERGRRQLCAPRQQGGAEYGGKLLSLDLWGEGVVISILHSGFMRTKMTADVGFDKYWDNGGGEYSYTFMRVVRKSRQGIKRCKGRMVLI
jgi:hypothetical protein